MMKRRDHEVALRKLKSQSPDMIWQLAQILKWNSYSGMHHEDDREVILISFTFLEDALKLLLKSHFGFFGPGKADRLFDGGGGNNAVLGNLYARSLLAETLDLISGACQEDLENVNLIRNTFAHSGHYLKFDNPSLLFLANLKTTSNLGESQEVRIDSEKVAFVVNLRTPRAKVLGFIILFWMYCAALAPPGNAKPFADIFGPKLPLPNKSAPRPISQSEFEDHMREAHWNPTRSSPE